MDLLKATLLGLLQGLTEFFPVSSSGHLVLAEELWGGFGKEDLFFNILLHLGTLAAVLVFCRREVAMLFRAAVNILRPAASARQAAERRLLVAVLIASAPTAALGLLIKLTIVDVFANLFFLGLMFMVTTALLIASGFLSGSKTDAGYGAALLAGTLQGVAVLPGISRSGATIVAAMAAGMEREAGARFAFTISIPAITGAAIVAALDGVNPANFNTSLIFSYFCGIIAAAFAGYTSLVWLTKIIRHARLQLFAFYCAAVGLLAFALAVVR